jgi:hypothetical protein
VAGVECRLPAAHLSLRDDNLEACLPQERLRVADRTREQEIPEARHEQLDGGHGYARIALEIRCRTSASMMIVP